MTTDIIQKLSSCEQVVLSTHTRPDGDAIGSQLALGKFLTSKGLQVRMINSDPMPYNLEWLPGSDEILVYDGSLGQVEAVAEADAVVILDTNGVSRLGQVGELLKGSEGTSILIDHHTDPEKWFDLSLRRESASSTGELLFELMAEWDLEAIDEDCAVALYVAIMTDTGSFRFSNVTPQLHRYVAHLLEVSRLNSASIHSEVFDKKSIEGLRLLSSVLSTVQLHHNGLVGSMVVSKRALKDSGASVEETDGFVNHLLSIEGVNVALMYTETERGTKISFRSKGDFHVHKWAQSFGGGGHRNAAGAFVRSDLESVIRNSVESATKFIETNTDEIDGGISDEDADYLSMLGVQN